MNIQVHQEGLIEEFISESVVFRIISIDPNTEKFKEEGMVTTYDNYREKLRSHLYLPIIFFCDLYLQLAYLYGCLNLKFGTPRSRKFIFLWRKIGTDIWKEWFTVHPYEDWSLFDKNEKI